MEGDNGAKKSLAKITQTYTGVISGVSETQYLMSYQSEVSAIFVGFEVITGEFNGQSGSLTLQHNGKFENGIASSQFRLVADAGTGELVGIAGEGSFTSGEMGQANYELTLKTE